MIIYHENELHWVPFTTSDCYQWFWCRIICSLQMGARTNRIRSKGIQCTTWRSKWVIQTNFPCILRSPDFSRYYSSSYWQTGRKSIISNIVLFVAMNHVYWEILVLMLCYGKHSPMTLYFLERKNIQTCTDLLHHFNLGMYFTWLDKYTIG